MAKPPERVAVTGATGYLGDRLVRRLEDDFRVRYILALDLRPPPFPFGLKVTFQQMDVSVPFGDLLSRHRIDSVVHLAYVMRPSHRASTTWPVNVGGTRNLLDACAQAEVGRIIYLSSTTVYGAHADNPPMLNEESPVRPIKGFQYSVHKAESEELLHQFARDNPGVGVTVLRCCPVMGTNPDNFVARSLSKQVLVAVKGYDPPLQFIHEDDATDSLANCLLTGVPGTYNIAGLGVIPWSEMAQMLGVRVFTLPAVPLYLLTQAAWWLRLQSDSPASALDLVRYRWTVTTEKAERELGIRPRFSSREAWDCFVRHRKMLDTARRPRR